MPGDSECTTPKPRGSHVLSNSVLITGLVLVAGKNGASGRTGGAGAQLVVDDPVVYCALVPAKYGLSS